MTLLTSLESLITGTPYTSPIPPSSDSLASLQAALSELPTSSPSDAASEVFGDEEEVDPRGSAATLWEELLVAAAQLEEPAWEAYGGRVEAKPSSSARVPSALAALDSHIEKAYSDASLGATVRLTVLDALGSARGVEEVSAELAEALGWDALELVEQLVSQRKEVSQAAADFDAGESSDDAMAPPPQASHHSIYEGTHSGPSRQHGVQQQHAYLPRSQMTFQSAEEIAAQKRSRAEARRLARSHRPAPGASGGPELSLADMERLRAEALEAAANRPLFSGTSTSSSEPVYPHVYTNGAQGNVLSAMGQKFALPAGTTRVTEEQWEEVTIPPPKQLPFRSKERLIPINELTPMARGAFPGYKSLNRLQSAVYPLGFATNENLLICAPTGAGKTDVAMLTVLRTISQYANEAAVASGTAAWGIRNSEFKIIYVAPMKALAAEVVRKFSKRLAYLGVKVRELTGDMQMTRQEIAETQMIVTTPEKWDVVTRKPTGEGELAAKVKLLIIDEVHLLHEDRGAVIETIVARTLRLVESSQSLIRIVGLSATLPNYIDVADFLRVNRMQGLFYFDSSFRPVPLEQHFIGVKGKAGSPTSRTNLDKAVFSKVQDLLSAGHQLMIFVHARKETVKTAMTMRDMCRAEGLEQLLIEGRNENPKLDVMKREVSQSRNKEMRELFESGLGIHHAGMLRSDRNISERNFESGLTRILCCTSTLAWGVNLPAYAVLIKGTEVYDSSVGKFVDLSILDVLQIFGRAGRPQYEDLGVGFICTNQDKLAHYIDAITSQHPIESKFITGLVDSLNAEVALGTVNSLDDGQIWLSYTYMFTRMKRNPMGYGMAHGEVADDPHLGAKRLQLVQSAARRLVACRMLELDEATGRLSITDLGRVAAKYYIPNRTIEIFNEKLVPGMSEADVLSVLSLATDFEQIIPRETEEKELKKMLENAPCDVPGGYGHSPGKVNVLLQAYISKVYIEDFALVSDSAYCAQNAGRIIRALMEIALARKWAKTTTSLMGMSKAIERRMWPFDHPLSVEQSKLSPDTVYNITRWADDVEVSTLAAMSNADIAALIHMNDRQGGFVKQAARQFPALHASYALRPLTHDLMRIVVDVERRFEWSEKLHGGAEPFVVWVEDEGGVEILQWQRMMLRPATASTSLSFIVSVPQPLPLGMTVRWISDRWLGAEDSLWLPFQDLIMPPVPPPHLPLLELPLLRVTDVLKEHVAESIYSHRFPVFNAIQTQAFHTLMHSRADVLLCAPTASGKSTLAEMAIWRALREDKLASVLVVHPQRNLSSSQAHAFRSSFADLTGLSVKSARTGKDFVAPSPPKPTVVFSTPAHVLRALAESDEQVLDHFNLVIIEDLHMLDAPLELLTSRLRRTLSRGKTRIVATAASLADASGLQEWLAIKPAATFSFHTSDRPTPLRLAFQSFDLPHSLTLLKAMVKPAYDRMKAAVGSGPSIVFVPSRSQCVGTATDLSMRSATDMDTESFLTVLAPELEPLFEVLSDRSLIDPLLHGIGVWHDGMAPRDQALILNLYDQGVIRALVVPREACWTLPARAHLVVVMSTQYVRLVPPAGAALLPKAGGAQTSLADRRTTDYSLAELLRMQSFAVRPKAAAPGECVILCQSDQAAYLQRMLSNGVPLESSLLDNDAEALLPGVLEDIAAGRVSNAAGIVEKLAWTYLFRQAQRNPSSYDVRTSALQDVSARFSDIADGLLEQLERAGCVIQAHTTKSNGASQAAVSRFEVTSLGRALAREPASLLQLASLQRATAVDPLLAAKFALSGAPSSSKDAAASQVEAEVAVMDATRAALPAEWLAAANVPRLGKPARPNGTAKPAEQPAAEGAEPAAAPAVPEEQPDASLSEAQRKALLLLAFFTARPLLTPGEATASRGKKPQRDADDAKMQSAKSKLVEEQYGAVRGVLRSLGRGAGFDAPPRRVR